MSTNTPICNISVCQYDEKQNVFLRTILSPRWQIFLFSNSLKLIYLEYCISWGYSESEYRGSNLFSTLGYLYKMWIRKGTKIYDLLVKNIQIRKSWKFNFNRWRLCKQRIDIKNNRNLYITYFILLKKTIYEAMKNIVLKWPSYLTDITTYNV